MDATDDTEGAAAVSDIVGVAACAVLAFFRGPLGFPASDRFFLGFLATTVSPFARMTPVTLLGAARGGGMEGGGGGGGCSGCGKEPPVELSTDGVMGICTGEGSSGAKDAGTSVDMA